MRIRIRIHKIGGMRIRIQIRTRSQVNKIIKLISTHILKVEKEKNSFLICI